ncbi:MAG: IS607 family transposase [Elusimicrobiota bacterium]|nr:IS607 family transposase [Endomicrobiia bacterium]MDW7999127.1 IS607 family transposase [Thermodesulfovibrio sp.]MDW8166736.1 IS607 family transposase [Elusimicrobiota bacterium]
MKLSDYAKKKGISYRTAWRWFKSGYIKGRQLPTGTIIVEEEDEKPKQNNRCIIYARVSEYQSKDNLQRQVERLMNYATQKGYIIVATVKEIGSGVNDKRKKLMEVLQRDDYDILLVEHKDRLTRFGFNYLQILLQKQGKIVEVVNLSEDDRQDLITDLLSIIYSFSARLYGLRRAKEKTEKIKKEILSDV